MKSLVPGSVAKLLQLQIVVVLITTIVTLVVSNSVNAYSALLGGLVCTLPNWIFAIIAFRHQGAQAAKRIMADFYWGEAVKLIITIALFTSILVTQRVAPLMFIVAFIVAQMTFWLAPFVKK